MFTEMASSQFLQFAMEIVQLFAISMDVDEQLYTAIVYNNELKWSNLTDRIDE